MGLSLQSLNFANIFGQKPHIGIDLGAAAVKVVALTHLSSSSPRLLSLGYEPTPPGALVDGTICDLPVMIEVLNSALKKAGLKRPGLTATIGIHGVNVVYRRLLLPIQSSEEMAQQVMLEAQQQVDSELSEWSIDYQIIGQPDAKGQVGVMLVCARRSALDDYIELLTKVGLEPLIFDCDVFAIENSYEQSTPNNQESALLLDIGHDTTKINILHSGTSVVARTLSTASTHLTEQIAKMMNIDLIEAETLKIKGSVASLSKKISQLPEVQLAIKMHIQEICEEVKKTVDFFVNEKSDSKIDQIPKIILSGGGSTLMGMSEGISRILKAPVSYATPFEKIKIPDKLQAATDDNPYIFSVATGLAMRHRGDKPK